MKILGWSFQITLQGPCLDETMTRQKPLYIYILALIYVDFQSTHVQEDIT